MSLIEISLDLANKFYAFGWRASVIGAAITMIGVFFLFWGTRVRDHDFEEQMSLTHERSAKLELEAASAKEQTAILALDAEKIRADNISLQTSLEKEQIARLKLEAHIAPRRLSPTEKKVIVAAIKPFAGQKCQISSILGNDEGKVYANDFVETLGAAGWDHHGDSGITYEVWDPDPIGVELSVHKVNAQQGEVNPAIQALIKVLKNLNLIGEPGVKMNIQTPRGEVQVRIGSKPPPAK